jgi:oligopeptide/dipeptide ABC transporter ATP-binding protein
VTALLEVRDLKVDIPVPSALGFGTRGHIHALRGVSFDLARGQTLALVGESGSGKSTTARAISRLARASGGTVRLNGIDFLSAGGSALFKQRSLVGMVFQDPYSSLNRRMRVGDIIAEPLVVHGFGDRQSRAARVAELLHDVGLEADVARRYPHAFSGGQRQRIAIARALALKPHLLICDEAVSALDVSVQAQILNLINDIKRGMSLGVLFITHDLGVVRRFADCVAVMHAGRIVELAPPRDLFARPLHPYTQSLLSAAPEPSKGSGPRIQRVRLVGGPVSPLDTPKGCIFASRCPHFLENICGASDPALLPQAPGHDVACHRADDLAAQAPQPTPARATGGS